jgi:hypothetical protein
MLDSGVAYGGVISMKLLHLLGVGMAAKRVVIGDVQDRKEELLAGAAPPTHTTPTTHTLHYTTLRTAKRDRRAEGAGEKRV